jgi:Xaa-Pro aminopeptidase
MAQMKPKSCHFNSNDIYPISADSTMPFAQHRDIFLFKRRGSRKVSIIISDVHMSIKEKCYF